MRSLKPYEEMGSTEVVTSWERMRAKAPNGYSLFMSPNKALWAIVDERRSETLQMWDVNTGHVVKQKAEEPIEKMGVCDNCGHVIRWQKVAVPPRWEHVRDGFAGGTNWICGCGCMDAKTREAKS